MSDMDYDCDIDVLIGAVKQREVIWNYNKNEYSNKTIKNRAWMDIVAEITPDFESKSIQEKNLIGLRLQSEWKNLKDAFMRNCRNMKKKSGSAASTPRLYPYHEQMLFLKNLTGERGSTNKDRSISVPSTPECTEATPGKRKINREEEDRLIQKISKRFEDKINREERLEKHEDEDKLFLLSLLSDFKKNSSDYKLDAKSEIIQVIKNYRDTSVNYSYTRYSNGPPPPSHANSYYYKGYSTTTDPPPPPPDHQTSTRPESSLSSYSYEGASTSNCVPPQTTSQLSSPERESELSPESYISDLFS